MIQLQVIDIALIGENILLLQPGLADGPINQTVN